SLTSASSTSQAPSGKPRPRSDAMRIASRVLPTPPGPTRLTSRAPDSLVLRSASSRRRPTKLVAAAGRLPKRRDGLAMVRKYYRRELPTPPSGPEQVIPPISAACALLSVLGMAQEPTGQRVEVRFVGAPPAQLLV